MDGNVDAQARAAKRQQRQTAVMAVVFNVRRTKPACAPATSLISLVDQPC